MDIFQNILINLPLIHNYWSIMLIILSSLLIFTIVPFIQKIEKLGCKVYLGMHICFMIIGIITLISSLFLYPEFSSTIIDLVIACDFWFSLYLLNNITILYKLEKYFHEKTHEYKRA